MTTARRYLTKITAVIAGNPHGVQLRVLRLRVTQRFLSSSTWSVRRYSQYVYAFPVVSSLSYVLSQCWDGDERIPYTACGPVLSTYRGAS